MPNDDWSPFENGLTFQLADFLYRDEQMSGANLDHLFALWAQRDQDGQGSPFTNHKQMYSQIDAIEQGYAPWQCMETRYNGVVDDASPIWKTRTYEVWHRNPNDILRNLLDNPDFHDAFDATPLQLFGPDDRRHWTDFMTGNYAWRQAVSIFSFFIY